MAHSFMDHCFKWKFLGMQRVFAAVVIAFTISAMTYAAEKEDIAKAYGAALKWLNILDAGRYDESWNEASTFFKTDVSRNDAKRTFEEFRLPLGEIKKRKIKLSEFNKAPDGDYLDFVFESDFGNKNSATETVEMVRERDGAWKVSSWGIR